jgi:proton-translocating NADH-quinone oxidoreductase chain M
MFHFLDSHRLSFQALIPVMGSRIRLLRPDSKQIGKISSTIALVLSGITLSLSVWIRMSFDDSISTYQRLEELVWIEPLHRSISLGIDGISRFFVRLNSFLTPLCILASVQGIQKYQKTYFGLFLLLEGIVNFVFRVTDVLGFYVSFEAVLIPMFFIIGRYGSRTRKIRAGYYFFLYTFFGSVFMLLSILYLYYSVGTRDMRILSNLNIEEYSESRSPNIMKLLWLGFFVGFAVKIPMLPVHIWLPEAHVEAPTAGSVILAGILLKLGSYGMIRVLVGMNRFAEFSLYFTPRVYARSLVGIIYTSRTAIRQTDMKRIIAYASVAHMNMTLVGLFSQNIQGIEGAILQMVSHGLVSGALFRCVGVLYDRHHTRRVAYYSGLVQTIPRFVGCFRFFTRANIALPGTSSFVGEFMILVGIFQSNTYVAVLSATGMILGGAYSLWLFNRISYGIHKQSRRLSTDLNRIERLTRFPLRRFTILLGVYPERRLNSLHASVEMFNS